MTKNVLTLWVAIVASTLFAASIANAQCDGCGQTGIASRPGIGSRLGNGSRTGVASRIGGLLRGASGGVAYNQDGMTIPNSDSFVSPRETVIGAVKDNFSPHRVYAHSNSGLAAANIHEWNNSQQNVYAWHGGYKNWQFGTPTALVVPPTAGYASSYAWGVGQTRSTPIHHQFGRGLGASLGGYDGSGFQTTPHMPTSTDEFGLYPVRAPW